MAEFVAFHPDNETLGRAFMGIIEVLEDRGVEELLKKYDLQDIHPEKWYPQQKELDILREISLSMDFVAIGMKLPDVVEYGVEVRTIADAFTLLNDGYKHNHRGPNIGGFRAEWTGKRSMRIVGHTPYPSDLDYGIIYRLVQKYHPDGVGSFSVLRDTTAPNRKLGAETDTFNIAW